MADTRIEPRPPTTARAGLRGLLGAAALIALGVSFLLPLLGLRREARGDLALDAAKLDRLEAEHEIEAHERPWLETALRLDGGEVLDGPAWVRLAWGMRSIVDRLDEPGLDRERVRRTATAAAGLLAAIPVAAALLLLGLLLAGPTRAVTAGMVCAGLVLGGLGLLALWGAAAVPGEEGVTTGSGTMLLAAAGGATAVLGVMLAGRRALGAALLGMLATTGVLAAIVAWIATA